MTGPAAHLALVVREVAELAPGIRQLTLMPADGARLPSYPPGSYLGLRWRHDRVNLYSLTGDGDRPAAYTVSVLRTSASGSTSTGTSTGTSGSTSTGTSGSTSTGTSTGTSGGGSAWVHELSAGAPVTAVAPRGGFVPAAKARRHLLVAGGIGITPLLAHARWHLRWGNDFVLYYAHKPGRAAHLDELRSLCGPRLRAYENRRDLWAELGPALRRQPLGTQLYVCGPLSMIDDVTGTAQRLHWAGSRIRSEAFGGPAFADVAGPRAPFRVTLAGGGRRIDVTAEETLLEALERAGVPAASMCRSGVCGECRTPVSAGHPDHRDLVLSAAEKAAGRWIMPCVSRAAGAELELGL